MSQARKQRARAAVDALVAAFPAAFDRFDRKPLKLGIAEDLAARGIAADAVRVALGSYCRSPDYWRRVTAGTPRVDLDGNPAGEVTAVDAEYAARKLTEAAEQAKLAQVNRDQDAKAQAAAAAKKAAEQAKPPKAAEPVRPNPAPRPPAGARPPLVVVRKVSRGGRAAGTRR